jgi:hypothetical protein
MYISAILNKACLFCTVQAEGPHPLPWFGAVQGCALVPPKGSLGVVGEPAAVMVLSKGGQLMLHDLKTLQPVPLSLPFQELPAVTASAFVPGNLPEEVGARTVHCRPEPHWEPALLGRASVVGDVGRCWPKKELC